MTTTTTTTTTDGHWPVFRTVAGVGHVIGCECGANPAKRSARASTQHCWHQTHRRGLRLAPVEYVWSDEAYHAAIMQNAERTSTGGLVQVRGAEWRDGGWVRV